MHHKGISLYIFLKKLRKKKIVIDYLIIFLIFSIKIVLKLFLNDLLINVLKARVNYRSIFYLQERFRAFIVYTANE